MRRTLYRLALCLALGVPSISLADDKLTPEEANPRSDEAGQKSQTIRQEVPAHESRSESEQPRPSEETRTTAHPESTEDGTPKASPLSGKTHLKARKDVIRVPPIKVIRDLKQAYLSGGGPHVLILLHVPKDKGGAFVEVYNRTKVEISLFRFTLTALGHEGELEFEGLPAGWSAVKEVKFDSIRELAIRSPRAVDKDASDITPRLVIHQTQMLDNTMKTGMRKLDP